MTLARFRGPKYEEVEEKFLTGEVALNGDAAIGFLVHQVGKHLAGLAGDVFRIVAVLHKINTFDLEFVKK